jgi:hypothetical protein
MGRETKLFNKVFIGLGKMKWGKWKNRIEMGF